MNELTQDDCDPLIADLMWKTSGFEASLRMLVESARALLARDASGDVDDARVWEEALRHLHYDVVEKLLEHLPTLAGPWEVTDTKNRAPTRAVRIGWRGEPIADVRKRGSVWAARVGDALVEHAPDDCSLSVFWPSFDAAKSACDDRLLADGVKFKDGVP